MSIQVQVGQLKFLKIKIKNSKDKRCKYYKLKIKLYMAFCRTMSKLASLVLPFYDQNVEDRSEDLPKLIRSATIGDKGNTHKISISEKKYTY